MRDSYTNRNHCPSHEMWSYERDGCWSGVLLYWFFYQKMILFNIIFLILYGLRIHVKFFSFAPLSLSSPICFLCSTSSLQCFHSIHYQPLSSVFIIAFVFIVLTTFVPLHCFHFTHHRHRHHPLVPLYSPLFVFIVVVFTPVLYIFLLISIFVVLMFIVVFRDYPCDFNVLISSYCCPHHILVHRRLH